MFSYFKRNKKKMIVLLVLAISLLIIIYLYLWGGYKVPYKDMYGGVKAVETDGVIYIYYYMTNTGRIAYLEGLERPIYFDYENGVEYCNYVLQIRAQRYNVFFNKGLLIGNDIYFTTDGYMLDGSYTIRGKINGFDSNIDYHEAPYLMDTKILRIYYKDPSGELHEIWEIEDADEIEKKFIQK